MMEASIKSKVGFNNFDLIRLFAAFEVAITHTARHLKMDLSAILPFIQYFPGVPIFFFISGFLIYQSFSNIKENRIRTFFTNRFLRLYPALIFCFLVTLSSLYLSGYLETQRISLKDFTTWTFTSLTFFQFYNPDFLRSYGVGAINGSLWTISVEIQFYLLTPLLFFLYQKHKKLSLFLAFIFVVLNAAHQLQPDRSSRIFNLIEVSFIPWLYMFMLGAYLSTNKDLQAKILTVNPLLYLGAYLSTYLLASKYHLGAGNSINFISYILLCLLVFRLAHTSPKLSSQLLKGNDISYGIYIYHMPIVNLWLFNKVAFTPANFLAAVGCTIFMALISWYFIEKPSLKLKKVALRSHT